ncbi:MAG TPA: cytochrome c oxidase assembly protein [Woeseiaceae bacterium]|nr:cytochrome c oxidase assembly protein [Woeseiaceae bacterium]
MNDKGTSGEISTRSLVNRLLLVAVGMFGFGFLLVPAYKVFCEITGLGGRTNEQPAQVAEALDPERRIDLEFVTTVNGSAPWTFAPVARGMEVHPGGLYEATFVATNLTSNEKIAQAVPSVYPPVAAKHLKKIDCFCFTTQPFEPNETRELLVRFVVDRELPDYVDTITLSYTLYDTARGTPETHAAASHGH